MTIENTIHDMIIERVTPLAQLVTELAAKPASEVDLEVVKKTVAAEIKKAVLPVNHEVTLRDHNGAETVLKDAHPQAGEALMFLQQPNIGDCNLYIWGEAGNGKTTLAKQLSEAMKLSFYYMGAALTKFDFLGYQLPNGTVVETPFMKAWIHGGVILIDDLDRGEPKAVAMMNMALANAMCDFSNTGLGAIPRHKDCYIVATGNTPMTGASANYGAASKQDGATKDRFQFLNLLFDKNHELKITPNNEWTLRVQSIRAAVKKLGGNIEKIIEASMRASFMGAPLIKAGMTQDKVEEAVIFKGAGKDAKSQVYSLVGKPSRKKNTILDGIES